MQETKKGLRRLIRMLDQQGVKHNLTKKTKINKHYGIEFFIENDKIQLVLHAKVTELISAVKKSSVVNKTF